MHFLTNTFPATLAKFVVKFDAALMTLWENEHDADHDSKYKNPTLITCLPMEKQLRDSYTNCIFYKCRAELARCMELQCEFGSQVDSNAIYTVTYFALNRTFEVVFNHSTKEGACICRLFETDHGKE
jgi:hypothetical protein